MLNFVKCFFCIYWLWFYLSFWWCGEWVSKVTQLCPTLCDPVDCSPPGSSIYGILQARILEWVAISFSRGSSQPRDQTQVSRIAGRRFNLWATRISPLILWYITLIDLQMLNHPCTSGINPTWICCTIILMYCWISLLIFYWGFLHLYSSGILTCNFLMVFLSRWLVSG